MNGIGWQDRRIGNKVKGQCICHTRREDQKPKLKPQEQFFFLHPHRQSTYITKDSKGPEVYRPPATSRENNFEVRSAQKFSLGKRYAKGGPAKASKYAWFLCSLSLRHVQHPGSFPQRKKRKKTSCSTASHFNNYCACPSVLSTCWL